MKIRGGVRSIGGACIAAATVALIPTRVAADCGVYQYDVLELTLESVTVDGQPDSDLVAYDRWTVRLEARPDEPPYVQFVGSDYATDDYCWEEFH